MRILFIGEVVGSAGIYCVKALLPEIRRELGIDLTIAAAEGATGGFGIGKGHAVYLHKLGVDVITAGDFAYYKRDVVSYFGQARYLLRPANYPYGNPGRGWLVARPRPPRSAPARPRAVAAQGAAPPASESNASCARPAADTGAAPAGATVSPPAAARSAATADLSPPLAAAAAAEPAGGRPSPGVGIISLLGQAGFSRVHLRNPFEAVGALVERVKQQTPIVLVDFHATTTSEKVAMSMFVDGKVTALIGTHVRTLSADARLLPGGTAAITHSGRTGSLNSVGGLDPEVETRKFLNQVHEQSRDAWGLLELQGVVLEVGENGDARSITALRRQTSAPEAARKAAQGQQRRSPARGRRASGRR